MSVESVIDRCIKNNPTKSEWKYYREDLLKDISIVMRRFEKVVKASYNSSMKGVFERCSVHPVKARNADFEKHKLQHIHDELEMLIDLYDYKSREKKC